MPSPIAREFAAGGGLVRVTANWHPRGGAFALLSDVMSFTTRYANAGDELLRAFEAGEIPH